METLSNIQPTTPNTPEILTDSEDGSTINLYPIVRHLFLTLCILLALSIIVFLLYQNGKSIYDKGI